MRYVDVWVTAIRGDDLSLSVAPTEQAALDALRQAWGAPDHVPDEALIDWTDTEYGVEVKIEQHSVDTTPEKPSPRETWVESVQRDGKCNDAMCACQTISTESKE